MPQHRSSHVTAGTITSDHGKDDAERRPREGSPAKVSAAAISPRQTSPRARGYPFATRPRRSRSWLRTWKVPHQKSYYAHVDRLLRLHQEHDHRRSSDDGAIRRHALDSTVADPASIVLPGEPHLGRL
jgi:hypothetical protein